MKKAFTLAALLSASGLALAQAAPAPAPGAGSMFSSLMFPIVLFGALFFIMIWPQMRQQKKAQKERDEMMAALAKGDEIVTNGGLLGKISKLGDTTVSVDLGGGTEVQLQRTAIHQVLPKGSVKL